MRISDWSSDVCSSDLLIGKADDVAAGEARKLARIRIGEMQQGVDPNVSKRQRKVDAERSGMTLAQGLAIYLAERDNLRRSTQAHYARDLRATFGDFLARPALDLTRAEEHTVDLPSLHHIANAHFC